ncbi:hypothetical protein D3C76_1420520 [compost metagenome]
MIIDHAYCLHKSITGGWANEFEAILFKSFGKFYAEFGLCWCLTIIYNIVMLWGRIYKLPKPCSDITDLCFECLPSNCIITNCFKFA